MNKFAERFNRDVMIRYQQKLAALNAEMEKVAGLKDLLQKYTPTFYSAGEKGVNSLKELWRLANAPMFVTDLAKTKPALFANENAAKELANEATKRMFARDAVNLGILGGTVGLGSLLI